VTEDDKEAGFVVTVTGDLFNFSFRNTPDL
jgi:hypothetical protein